ncbi:MAG: hypothetical protein K2X66_12250 [Cyanobacteria bacterium]|nr:hypothetical protein [Cyanobacteriota bacterium]
MKVLLRELMKFMEHCVTSGSGDGNRRLGAAAESGQGVVEYAGALVLVAVIVTFALINSNSYNQLWNTILTASMSQVLAGI